MKVNRSFGGIEFMPETIEEYLDIENMVYYNENGAFPRPIVEAWMRDWMEWHVKNFDPDVKKFISSLMGWGFYHLVIEFFSSPDDCWDDMTFWVELSGADLSKDTLNLMGRALQIREDLCKDYLKGGDE